MKTRYNPLLHPFETYIPPDAKYLVLGTFPTRQKNWNFDFYYSNPDNRFWPILEGVFEKRFVNASGGSAKDERKQFLEKNKIGITDMLRQCYRLEETSGDEHLYPIVLTDIFSLLDTNRSIETLILTSRTEVFGALGLLKTYFLQQGRILETPHHNSHNILEGWFAFNRKDYEVLVPLSPSSRQDKADLSQLISMYRICFT